MHTWSVGKARIRGVRLAFGTLGFLACLVFLLLAACGPDTGLRVEKTTATPRTLAEPSATAGPADLPYDESAIRASIIDDDTLTSDDAAQQVVEVLASCPDCLTMAAPITADGRKFQVAMVSTPQEKSTFAGVVVADEDGRPDVELVVSGFDLTLTPGSGGTLVAQEKKFAEGDPDCCPSGWSVRVFRMHDGRFEQGQRITQG